MVKKKDGTWRPCGDYRQLNLVTKPDLYPPPNIQDLSTKLEGMKVFTTINLRKGYWQIPVEAKDVHKTAVITPFGLWEFLRMPFGLKNAGQSVKDKHSLERNSNLFTFVTSWDRSRDLRITRKAP